MAVVLGMDVKAKASGEEEGDRTRRCPEYQRGPRRMEGTTLGDCERTRSIRVLAPGHSMGGSSLIVGLTNHWFCFRSCDLSYLFDELSRGG